MAPFKAIIFGSIGTLTETSEMQRQSFNLAFAELGYDWHWDATDYRDMVAGAKAVVGGSDRIAQFAETKGVRLKDSEIRALHAAKSRIFRNTMADDGLPLNAGVNALIVEARVNGVQLAFASTTSRANIDVMLDAVRPSIAGQFDLILSGDDVAQAKPAPDIYRLALERLRLNASEVVAIEDSAPSLVAAISAGIATIVVPGTLWTDGTFRGALAVLTSLDGITVGKLAELHGRKIITA